MLTTQKREIVHRSVGSVRPNRNANHATLKMRMMQPASPLLDAYTYALLGNDGKQEHFDILYSYFQSHNILSSLLTSLAQLEVRYTNINNPLFRGNTPFNKFYTTYVQSVCSDFIVQTSEALINHLKEIKYDDKQNYSDIHYYNIIQTYFSMIDQSFKTIPYEFLWMLHNIYKETRFLE